jgi:hypothetical protein
MGSGLFTGRGTIITILILQIIPLLLFPLNVFSTQTQEWWLPILLSLMVIASVLELIVRGSTAVWPWNLMSFAQGFNIISRLMMVWPHATIYVNGESVLNLPYIILTLISMALSAFMIWFFELPEVRMSLVRDQTT